jgi:predicted GNAT family N-acyltransferase
LGHSFVSLIGHEETWPLRHLVLRAGKPLETCRWPGDEEPSTRHFALRAADGDELGSGEIIAIASIYQRSHEAAAPGPDSWQLRGMATRPDLRGRGLGGQLLVQLMAHCRDRLQGRIMWCNARSSAVPFYLRHGFETVGVEFLIEGIGPHYVMRRTLGK